MADEQTLKQSFSPDQKPSMPSKGPPSAMRGIDGAASSSSLNGPPPFRTRPPAPRRPSAEEMIDYYSRKGLDKQEASTKVIEDLQKALSIAMNRISKKSPADQPSISGTLDSFSKRVTALEAKVDELPGFGGVFVAGIAAGGFLHAVPHIVTAAAQIGQSLKQAVSSKP